MSKVIIKNSGIKKHAVFTDDEVRYIINSKLTITALAKQFDVSRQTVRRAKNRKTHTWVEL